MLCRVKSNNKNLPPRLKAGGFLNTEKSVTQGDGFYFMVGVAGFEPAE